MGGAAVGVTHGAPNSRAPHDFGGRVQCATTPTLVDCRDVTLVVSCEIFNAFAAEQRQSHSIWSCICRRSYSAVGKVCPGGRVGSRVNKKPSSRCRCQLIWNASVTAPCISCSSLRFSPQRPWRQKKVDMHVKMLSASN